MPLSPTHIMNVVLFSRNCWVPGKSCPCSAFSLVTKHEMCVHCAEGRPPSPPYHSYLNSSTLQAWPACVFLFLLKSTMQTSYYQCFQPWGDWQSKKSFQDQSLLTGFFSGPHTPLAGCAGPDVLSPKARTPRKGTTSSCCLRRIMQHVDHEFEDLPQCFLL